MEKIEAIYHLSAIPADRKVHQWTAKDKTENIPAEFVLWSNVKPPPAIGDRVTVKINELGPGVVIGYFIEARFLGVYVRPDVRPAWHLRQTDKDYCMPFGAELAY